MADAYGLDTITGGVYMVTNVGIAGVVLDQVRGMRGNKGYKQQRVGKRVIDRRRSSGLGLV